MPGSGRYGVYTYDMVGQNSVTNSTLFDTIFHHKSSLLTHEQLVAVAAALLTPAFASKDAAAITGLPNTNDVPGPMCDAQMFPQGVGMKFTDAPSYAAIKAVISPAKGAEGWPTTVYTPPLASPGAGNGADPTKIPVTDITEQTIHPNYPGPDQTVGTVTPATTAVQISAPELDPNKELLVKGSHPGIPIT